MMIKIKYFGEEFELGINPDSKVEDIKQIVEEKECIPIRQQRLIFSGKPMLNEKSANDYKLENGSIIYLTKTLSGLVNNSAEFLKCMEQFRSYELKAPEVGK
jgi:ubiquitin-like protein Nedd8